MDQHHTFWKVLQLDSQKLQLKLTHPHMNLSLADTGPVEVVVGQFRASVSIILPVRL